MNNLIKVKSPRKNVKINLNNGFSYKFNEKCEAMVKEEHLEFFPKTYKIMKKAKTVNKKEIDKKEKR